LIARPRRYSRAGLPTLSVSTIEAVLVQSKPTPPPAKAPSAFRSRSIRIEASVGPRGACRGRVLTAHRAAHRSQGPRRRAAARLCRVRLAICHQCARCLPEVRFFCVVPAGRPVPVSLWRILLDMEPDFRCIDSDDKGVHKRLESCDPFLPGSPPFRRSLPDPVIAWIFVRFLNTWGSTLLGTLSPSS